MKFKHIVVYENSSDEFDVTESRLRMEISHHCFIMGVVQKKFNAILIIQILCKHTRNILKPTKLQGKWDLSGQHILKLLRIATVINLDQQQATTEKEEIVKHITPFTEIRCQHLTVTGQQHIGIHIMIRNHLGENRTNLNIRTTHTGLNVSKMSLTRIS